MNWRALAAVAASVFLALGFASAYSQSASSTSVPPATVSLNHSYNVSTYGYGVLNDTFTFKDNGNASEQIPTLQVGIPNSISSRWSDLALVPSANFSLSTAENNATTTLTITPSQPSLAAGADASVAVKAIMNNIIEYPKTGYTIGAPLLVLMSPSVNVNLAEMNTSIILPAGGYLAQTPTGFTASAKNVTSPSFTLSQTSVQPTASAMYLNFTSSSETDFTPMTVEGLVTTIVPSSNGTPVVHSTFVLHNVAGYPVNTVKLSLLNPTLDKVTVIPNTVVPLIDAQVVALGSGIFTFSSTTLGGPLEALSNMSVEISYPLPTTMMAVSGNTVKLTIPTGPVVAQPVTNYTLNLAPVKGITETGTTSYRETWAPFTAGTVQFTYSVPIGWGADQAIPAAILVFAVAFAMFAMQRPEAIKEKAEKVVRTLPDVLKAFDAKTGLETQYMSEMASAPKGSLKKTDFDRMREEVNDLRNRAVQRLSEMRKELGSGKQFDLLGQVAEAEKEEDRAFRDLLNLYFQYNGNRMNEETFRRLQPNYKKRVESAVNHLSDLLHQVQTEER